jgi:hypothetical protein
VLEPRAQACGVHPREVTLARAPHGRQRAARRVSIPKRLPQWSLAKRIGLGLSDVRTVVVRITEPRVQTNLIWKVKIETAGRVSLGCGQLSVGREVTNRVTIK